MYTKYIEALRMMDEVIAVGKDEKQTLTKWDELFTYIHANFESPHIGKAAEGYDVRVDYNYCRPVIDGSFRENMEEVIRSIPPILLDIVWPIGIARFLLRENRVKFNHRWSTTFGEFHDRYGYMILEC
jgi:hypothetical protein